MLIWASGMIFSSSSRVMKVLPTPLSTLMRRIFSSLGGPKDRPFSFRNSATPRAGRVVPVPELATVMCFAAAVTAVAVVMVAMVVVTVEMVIVVTAAVVELVAGVTVGMVELIAGVTVGMVELVAGVTVGMVELVAGLTLAWWSWLLW
ncbi:hypothetical protein ANANG_G00167360 [Anguilla anguilla]|uniref:Uncharacterized protein n=1 Tax=Anguilla anguilla TaxID=7936 RepID=A0A9D3RVB0_ANGAN|nr:hypothetical protein ANANG_G00167360 [Anguilla anguilla]